jgi:protein-disulfide isomerase
MKKTFIIILLVVAGLGYLLFGTSSKDGSSVESSHVEGTGLVRLVEFGDFQCPVCGAYYPVIEAVREKYAGKLEFQFRHFPIVTAHPKAQAAHRAAEAAAIQGKFNEMYNLLYQNQTQISSTGDPNVLFDGYAQSIGMDLAKFKLDRASSDVNSIISADKRAGDKLGVSGTPTFLLDGKKDAFTVTAIRSQADLEAKVAEISRAIDAALATKGQPLTTPSATAIPTTEITPVVDTTTTE